MKYFFRTLWLIGYIFIFIFEMFCFFISIFIYPIVCAFYFIITGSIENNSFTPDIIPIALDNMYNKLLKYM